MRIRMNVTARPAVRAAILCAAALTAGCSSISNINVNPMTWWSGPQEQVPAQLVGATLYECEGNKRFAVRFGTAGQPAMVILPEREFRLDPAPGAPGTSFTNGRSTLTTKGDEASLDEGGSNQYSNCKRRTAAAAAS